MLQSSKCSSWNITTIGYSYTYFIKTIKDLTAKEIRRVPQREGGVFVLKVQESIMNESMKKDWKRIKQKACRGHCTTTIFWACL